MRKVVVHGPGGYERLVVEEHPDPALGPDEVLVDVDAAGVNYADCIVRMGLYASAKAYVGWPITPGFEVAGRVAAVGARVADLEVGAAVVAVTRFGAYATRLAVPRAQVFGYAAHLSPLQAATLPTVYLTADYALNQLGRPRAGDRVLIHSAAGGVGSALMQLARHAGCTVVGVVGDAHKVETAYQYGAHYVVDKSTEPLWAAARRYAPGGYHLIADANGVATLGQSYRHLAPTGRLVIYGFHTMLPKGRGRPRWGKLALDWLRTPRFNPLDMTGSNRSVLAFNLSYLFDQQSLLEEAMRRLLDLADRQAIRPLPVTTYPFEAVAEAHQALESGRTVGKLALTVASATGA